MTPPAELTRHHPCPRGRHLLGVALALLAGLSLLVGCGGGGSDDSRTGTTRRRSTTSTSMSTDDDAATTTTLPLDATRVRLVDLDLDAKDPIDLAVRPGSRSLLIAERGGKIREAVQDTDGIGFAEEPVIDLTDAVGSTDMERGMLGIAVAPDGRHLYLSYTEKSHGDSRIDEYPLSGTDGELRADPAGRRQLVSIVQPFPNHNGGSLRFGPDRMLYAGFGDGGGAGDPNGNGQRRDTLLGKILRIDPEAPDGIPADNPFVTDGRATDGRATDGAEPLIWATGLRNPWRIDFDPATGDLWIGDVGQDRIEEIDRLTPSAGRPAGYGANLGWNLFEGNDRFDRPTPASGAASAGPFVDPVLTYTHDEGCSITGGVVVRDPRLPSLTGAFLYSDFCAGGVRAVRQADDGTVQQVDLHLDVPGVVSFGRGPDGEIYVISLQAGVQRIDPA